MSKLFNLENIDAEEMTLDELKEIVNVRSSTIINVNEKYHWYLLNKGYRYFASLDTFMLKGELDELI